MLTRNDGNRGFTLTYFPRGNNGVAQSIDTSLAFCWVRGRGPTLRTNGRAESLVFKPRTSPALLLGEGHGCVRVPTIIGENFADRCPPDGDASDGVLPPVAFYGLGKPGDGQPHGLGLLWRVDIPQCAGYIAVLRNVTDVAPLDRERVWLVGTGRNENRSLDVCVAWLGSLSAPPFEVEYGEGKGGVRAVPNFDSRSKN